MKSLAIKFVSILMFLTGECISQEITDTLYLFPDTNTFINEGIVVVEDVSNFAVKFSQPYNWNDCVIDKIIVQFHSNSAQTDGLPLDISTGAIP